MEEHHPSGSLLFLPPLQKCSQCGIEGVNPALVMDSFLELQDGVANPGRSQLRFVRDTLCVTVLSEDRKFLTVEGQSTFALTLRSAINKKRNSPMIFAGDCAHFPFFSEGCVMLQ